MRPGPSDYPRPDCPLPVAQCPNATNPGRTHRFYTGQPVVPFGFGLSYTTFKYTVVSGPVDAVSLAPVQALLDAHPERAFVSMREQAPLVNYMVNVTNTGLVDADDVVLGMLIPPGAGQNGVPLQTLFGFERVHVPAGQTVTVFIYPTLADFTTVDKLGALATHPGEYTVRFGIPETAAFGQGYAQVTLMTTL